MRWCRGRRLGADGCEREQSSCGEDRSDAGGATGDETRKRGHALVLSEREFARAKERAPEGVIGLVRLVLKEDDERPTSSRGSSARVVSVGSTVAEGGVTLGHRCQRVRPKSDCATIVTAEVRASTGRCR